MGSGRIPQQFIDELLARTDIVDVIDSRVTLKKGGRDYAACCPFHKEKTPSFTVSREKQFYHCFGCGAHGSAISFVMEFDGLGFVEAVEDLARQAGIEVPREGGGQETAPRENLDNLYKLLEKATAFYARQLRDKELAKDAVAYLKGRGLSGEIAAVYKLGYAPAGWDHLVNELGQSEQDKKDLLRLGLTASKGPGSAYDRFRQRIIYPIRDSRGRVIGFGGRAIGDDKPKYLNSPESPVFHKGTELYGLYEARKADRKVDYMLVVEGYMDAIGLAQAGITNVVATLGTATTPEHIKKLFRYTPDLVFCFDGDQAGRKAAWKALENLLPELSEGRMARFMFLPEGEDPDSMVRRIGSHDFYAHIEKSIPFSTFFFDVMLKKADISSIDGRARLIELARPMLSKIPNGVFRHMLLSRLGELAQVDVGKLGMKPPPEPEFVQESQAAKPRLSSNTRLKPSLVRKALQMLLINPSLAQLDLPINELKNLNIPGFVLLLEVIEKIRVKPHISTGILLENWRGTDEGNYLARILQLEAPPESGQEQEFLAIFQRLQSESRNQELDALIQGSNFQDDEQKRLLKEKLDNYLINNK